MANQKQSLNGSEQNVSVDDLAAQIDTLKNDISELTRVFSDFGSAKATEATRAVKDKAEELRSAGQEKASELHQAGRERALEAQLQAEDFMRRQPATALGIAAGVGFLVGMIATSSRR